MPENAPAAPTSPSQPPLKNTGGEKKKLIYLAALPGLLILTILVTYFIFLTDKTRQQRTGDNSGTPSATKAAQANEVSYCTSGQVYENRRQGYKVCLIRGWYHSEFGYSAASVGFDPEPIPEASEYGGLIMVSVQNRTTGAIIGEAHESLVSETDSPVTVDGTSGTHVIGDIPADSFYFANYKQVVSVFGNLQRVYRVTLLSPPERFSANQSTYNNFLASWRFLAGTPSPPWSSSGNIEVEIPWPGDSIENPVTISGQALVFEGTVNIRIKDANGTVLADTTAQAASGVEMSSFSKVVAYSSPSTSTGTIEVFSISAKDGGEQDRVEISVRFR